MLHITITNVTITNVTITNVTITNIVTAVIIILITKYFKLTTTLSYKGDKKDRGGVADIIIIHLCAFIFIQTCKCVDSFFIG